MLRDYIIIILIAFISVLGTGYMKQEKELKQAKVLAVEYYEEYNIAINELNSRNKYVEELEENIPLLKELHRITK